MVYDDVMLVSDGIYYDGFNLIIFLNKAGERGIRLLKGFVHLLHICHNPHAGPGHACMGKVIA